MSGRMNSLAALFTPPTHVNGSDPASEATREAILDDLNAAAGETCEAIIAIANDGTMGIGFEGGARIFIRHDDERKLTTFDAIDGTTLERWIFWMNDSSVKDLMTKLAAKALHRMDAFEAIMVGSGK